MLHGIFKILNSFRSFSMLPYRVKIYLFPKEIEDLMFPKSMCAFASFFVTEFNNWKGSGLSCLSFCLCNSGFMNCTIFEYKIRIG